MKRLLLASFLAASACGRAADPPPAAAADEGFDLQGQPRPGEWRDRFREDGQTFEQYVEDCANRRAPGREVFCLQPLGDALERHRDTLDLMRGYAEAFFGVPARVLDPLPMPEEAFHEERRQHNSTTILRWLARRMPEDAVAFMGLTTEDLYSRRLNFVFGEASLRERTGVYSLHRYQTPDARLFRRRSLKLMTHEAGHILSIEHCVFYRCVMQGANSLHEDDGHPMHLCPVDLKKIEWNTGVGRRERYRRLLDFYRGAGLEAEAEWVARRLAP